MLPGVSAVCACLLKPPTPPHLNHSFSPPLHSLFLRCLTSSFSSMADSGPWASVHCIPTHPSRSKLPPTSQRHSLTHLSLHPGCKNVSIMLYSIVSMPRDIHSPGRRPMAREHSNVNHCSTSPKRAPADVALAQILMRRGGRDQFVDLLPHGQRRDVRGPVGMSSALLIHVWQ